MSNKTKNTLIKGALTSSFGMFVSKILGLIYVVPLNSFAGAENMSFYSIAYSLYSLLLTICSAGVPFAIASLVAKFAANDDYRTVKLVKKTGESFVLILSFVILTIFFCFVTPISRYNLGASATEQDVIYLRNCYLILGFAVMSVPYLSTVRGYYQGLKNMKVYAKSQVVDQLFRVLAIVILGYVSTRILKLDSIFAIYGAVLAAAVGAIVSLIYIKVSSSKLDKEVEELVKKDPDVSRTTTEILKEIFNISIPYIAASILGTTSSLINSNFFINYATQCGVAYDQAKLTLGIFQVNCSKLSSIPAVLTLGFSASLVPYLTESFEKKDLDGINHHINDILDTVMYLLMPMTAAFLFLARPMYYVMFGAGSLDLGANLLAHTSILVLTDTISPILVTILITLRRRKYTIWMLIIGTVFKAITFLWLIKTIGHLGIIYSSFANTFVCIVIAFSILILEFKINLKRHFKNSLVITLSVSMMCVVLLCLSNFLKFTYTNRFLDLIILGVYGLIGLVIYILITDRFGLVKNILKIDLKGLKNKIIK